MKRWLYGTNLIVAVTVAVGRYLIWPHTFQEGMCIGIWCGAAVLSATFLAHSLWSRQ